MKIFTGGGLIGWLAKAREEKILVVGRMVGNVSSVEKD